MKRWRVLQDSCLITILMGKIDMQKKDRKLIYKPYAKGKALSKQMPRRAVRIMLLILITAIFYLFTGQILVMVGGFLRIILSAIILVLVMGFFYYEGAVHGEEDVGLGEIVLSRSSEGQESTLDEQANCYNPLKGFVSVAVGILPFFIMAVVFAMITQKQVYKLGVLPSWLTAFQRHRDIEIALNYYNQSVSMGLEGVLRIIIRMLLFPFVHFFGADNASNMFLMERLSPLLICVAPLGYAVGYLSGPKRRASVHGDIAEGKKRQRVKTLREIKKRRQGSEGNRIV